MSMDSTGDTPAPRSCPWCSERVTDEATHCPACGAALAQRESIGDLLIPGVTDVDPALAAYAAQPLRIPGASPSQAIAGPAVGAAAATGGVVGLAALGGLAAVAAAEYLAAGRDDATRAAELEKLGQPSEAVLEMVKRLDKKFEKTDTQTPDPDEQAADPRLPPPGASGIY